MSQKKDFRLKNNSARNAAVNALLAFGRDGSYIQDTLDEIFRRENLPVQERRLASELSYGSCRRLISLDHLIKQHSKR